jgi:2'-5' RNA ligase
VRLFFAIVPAEDALRELARAAADIAAGTGGRAMAGDKIHLTLAFLGEIAEDRVPDARAAASAVRARPFTLVLDRLGSFRRAGVAWAGASMPDPELLRLQGTLAVHLEARGFALEVRPFAPHVTLARKVERPLAARELEAVGWRVTDFTLVRSNLETGKYETLERYPLG